MDSSSQKKTILLIDQNTSLTDLLSTRLVNVGFNMLVANQADMALKLAQISTPDVILLELLMKTNDGKDILTQIKLNQVTANIPIIILSSDLDSKLYGFLSGENDYIVKPFKFDEVLGRINNQIRISEMQKELEKKNHELLEKNLLLEKMAITDSLTGLYNRAYVLDRLSTEVLRCARYKEPISFLMIDIDFFKKINDTYGHLTGDAVLKIVANQLKNSTREIDIVGRYGGEEFIVICPNADILNAKIIAERIRVKAMNSNLSITKGNISVTLSIGISCSIPKMFVNTDAFITTQIGDADIALYKAKSSGRNRVETFDSCSDIEDSVNIPEKNRSEDSDLTNKLIENNAQ
jgi:diguanylate cyclase (GGDEF)-like protein